MIKKVHWGFNLDNHPKINKIKMTDEALEELSRLTREWIASEEGSKALADSYREVTEHLDEQERLRRVNPIDLSRRITL